MPSSAPQGFSLMLKKFDKDMLAYSDWEKAGRTGEPLEEPTKPTQVDELYDGGTTLGLGQLMADSQGRAFWLKHEARKLIKKLMDGQTVGSFDELNQVAEHAYFRNSPLNNQSKFCVENPHLVTFWLLHLEACFLVLCCATAFAVILFKRFVALLHEVPLCLTLCFSCASGARAISFGKNRG
jgi:hypothetical protein